MGREAAVAAGAETNCKEVMILPMAPVGFYRKRSIVSTRHACQSVSIAVEERALISAALQCIFWLVDVQSGSLNLAEEPTAMFQGARLLTRTGAPLAKVIKQVAHGARRGGLTWERTVPDSP